MRKGSGFSEKGTLSKLGLLGSGFRAMPLKLNRMLLLNSVWEKEAGSMAAHWELYGVKGTVVYIKPRSCAAWQELTLRSTSLIRSLNKYFESPWIKAIKRAQEFQ